MTHGDVDIFDRERVFIDRVLARLQRPPGPAYRLRAHHHGPGGAVRERSQAPTWAPPSPPTTCSTTARDLLAASAPITTACLPVLKRETHREALVRWPPRAATSSSLGTDSAPRQEHQGSCLWLAGCYTAPCWHPSSTPGLFEQAGALDRLGKPSSFNGPISTCRATPSRWSGKTGMRGGVDSFCRMIRWVPLRGGETIGWKLA